MMTSKQIVDVILDVDGIGLSMPIKTGMFYVRTSIFTDFIDMRGFESMDELACFLAGLSLTHTIDDINRTDYRNGTDIGIFIVPSEDGGTNIDAAALEAILKYCFCGENGGGGEVE